MGDHVFLESQALDQLPGAEECPDNVPEYAAKGRYHKGGTNAGLRAHGIAQLVRLPGSTAHRKGRQVGVACCVTGLCMPCGGSADNIKSRAVHASQQLPPMVGCRDCVQSAQHTGDGSGCVTEGYLCRVMPASEKFTKDLRCMLHAG